MMKYGNEIRKNVFKQIEAVIRKYQRKKTLPFSLNYEILKQNFDMIKYDKNYLVITSCLKQKIEYWICSVMFII